MKSKIGPALGIAGTFLVATGLFLRTGGVAGATIIHGLGTVILCGGFLPWLMHRQLKVPNKLQRIEYLLGILGTMFLINGILWKYMHWPTASVQMALSVFLFVFGYLPFSFHLRWKEAGTRLQKAFELVRFLTLFIILTGFIFKIMHWPGAGIGISLGVLFLPLYLLFYFILRFRNQGKLPFDTGDLLITLIAFSVWSFANSSQVSKGALEGYRLLEDQYLQMNAGLESGNTLIYESIDSLSSPEDDSFMAPVEELRRLGTKHMAVIDSAKNNLYKIILMEYYREGSNHLRIRLEELGNHDMVFVLFIQEGWANVIKENIEAYKKGVLELAARNNIGSASLGLGLETADIVYGNGYSQTWLDYIFGEATVGSVIVNLSLFKQMMMLTESTALNGLIGQMDLSGEALLLQEIAAKESEKAIALKENEIARAKQQQKLQEVQLEQSQMATKQNRIMAITAFAGVILVLILFSISTRAFLRKQKDNKKLEEQKGEISDKNDELNQQNEEIASQRDEIEAQRDLVSSQKDQLEKTHEELTSSIDYAMRLQASILPGPELLKEHFSDHFILFRPRDRVSGDFYWWTKVEEHLVITAADCTGHGVPGAFMSMLGVSLLREIVNREFISKPEVILQKLRKEIIRSLNQKGALGEQKDGMDMALVSINPDTLHCEFSGANNSLYLLRKGELLEFKADRMPISYYERMDRFTSHEIKLEKSDRLYLFSDGYVDQFGGERRRKFKTRAFKDLLIQHAGSAMPAQKKILEETIIAWQGNFEQIDDILVLGIEI